MYFFLTPTITSSVSLGSRIFRNPVTPGVQSLQGSKLSRSPVTPGGPYLLQSKLSRCPVFLESSLFRSVSPGDLSLQCPVCPGVLYFQKSMQSLHLSCLSRDPVTQGSSLSRVRVTPGVQFLQESSFSKCSVSPRFQSVGKFSFPGSLSLQCPASPRVLSLKEYSLSRILVTPGVQSLQESSPSKCFVSQETSLSKSPANPGVQSHQESSLFRSQSLQEFCQSRSLVSPGVQSLQESVSSGIEISFLPLQLPSCYVAAPLVGPQAIYHDYTVQICQQKCMKE